VSDGAADGRPQELVPPWRTWCLPAALVALLLALVPPVSGAARRIEYAQALQFALVAVVVPALVTASAPWRWLGLKGLSAPGSGMRWVDRLADQRRRRRELPRSLVFIAADIAVVVAWHTPVAVAAGARHGWLAPVEAATLLVFGVGLWLELISSPPLAPRSGHLRRAVLAALAMWALWTLAYVVGMSNHDFYSNFHHDPGGLSGAADQQIASAVLWLVSALAFVPVIFWNALMWLKTEDDPDTELIEVLRAARRGGTRPVGGGGTQGP
jgi:cytochrome c oxidase assembly factor CtaG